ncbi:hypothetical protein C8J56DRAFT_1039237 [Mycena floridula]|nr:hypothetical protein C8J56DRAFT_1039237 [Mycena floridula]
MLENLFLLAHAEWNMGHLQLLIIISNLAHHKFIVDPEPSLSMSVWPFGRPVIMDETVIKSLQLLLISKYGYIAAEMLVVVDILLTLDLEVNLVWARQISLGKILFLLAESLPPTSEHGGGSIFLVWKSASIAPILALKTYALYQTRWSIYLLGFGVVFPSFMVIITDIYMERNAMDWNVLLPGNGCVPNCTGKICTVNLVMYWAQFTGFDTMVVWLMAWRAYTISRARRQIVRASPADQMYPYSGFLRLLFRDGFIYYSCISACAVLNILATLIAPSELTFFSISMSRALQTVGVFESSW